MHYVPKQAWKHSVNGSNVRVKWLKILPTACMASEASDEKWENMLLSGGLEVS